MTAAMFPEDAFTLSGEVKAYGVTADSGNQVDRYFCPDCGGRLYAINSGNPGICAVMVGSLDHPEVLDPGVVVYGDSQLPWDIHDDNLPVFPKMPG